MELSMRLYQEACNRKQDKLIDALAITKLLGGTVRIFSFNSCGSGLIPLMHTGENWDTLEWSKAPAAQETPITSAISNPTCDRLLDPFENAKM
jgi:hypothetical protein